MYMQDSSATRVDATGTSIKRGSAWISAKASEHASAQQLFALDPKYKKYSQQVEKCLTTFDNVHEWADCIAFLKQLLKTFQSYVQFKDIPRNLIVAKRLSQCLNPALPTGVHQRALDVYAHVLSVIGPEGLKRDLQLWSSGIFPFFAYAATSVKPMLLNLYETYYVPLQESLRPIMKAFIMALLPGLEEDTGEFFDKVLSLLDKLSGSVSPSFFLQNVWLVLLTSPSSRGTAINFLSRRLPRLNAYEDITSIVGRDVGLMIRAFAAALEDDNVLVRRGALDMLVQSLRVDSVALKKASGEDRAILMRAATSVVLRRDLSLNRRLYLWLLGSAEGNEKQLTYFREYALELLRSTLRDEMYNSSSGYSDSRPYKVFVSLLDKWEIGAPLTDALIFDALKAIKGAIESGSDSGEDVLVTASTLYEAVEPHAVWKQLFSSVCNELLGDGQRLDAMQMTTFVLTTFRVQEEEVQTMHLPVIFTGLVDLLTMYVSEDGSKASIVSTREALRLSAQIVQHIPPTALIHPQRLASKFETNVDSEGSYRFACAFYGIQGASALSRRDASCVPFVTALENLLKLTAVCAENLLAGTKDPVSARDALIQSLSLTSKLIAHLPGTQQTTFTMNWDPIQWLWTILGCLDHQLTTFTLVDHVIDLTVSLTEFTVVEPRLSINERSTLFKMINALCKYLRPNCAPYHARAVFLLWAVENVTQHHHVESIIAQSLASPESRCVEEAYEVFGVLWRLSEDSSLPGFRFKIPMMIVLDTLKSDDPTLRRIGETWMRCSLKSYTRVLDPVIHDLLDSSLRWTPVVNVINGRELQGFLYERPFDQRRMNHLLEVLLSLVRFGGQGFGKITRSTPIAHSLHSGLIQRMESTSLVGVSRPGATYLDVLVALAIRFLLCDPKPHNAVIMSPFNVVIQSTSIDFLQAIMTRGDITPTTRRTIEAAVIGRLYLSVHTHRLDLQNKLLHLLHSVIAAVDAPQRKTHDVKAPSADELRDELAHPGEKQDSTPGSSMLNPLLIQTLIDGIGTKTNRPLLQHWLDFVLMTVPQFQHSLHHVLTPLNECVCQQVHLALVDVLAAFAMEPEEGKDIISVTTDTEFIMLLNALERLILLSLSNNTLDSGPTEEESSSEKSGPDSLLGYVSNVFGSDTTSAPEEQLTARSPGYRSLHEGIRILFSVWATLNWNPPKLRTSTDDSMMLIYTRTKLRCRKVLEHLFRVQSAEVLESIVECWSRGSMETPSNPEGAFEIIDILTASAQTVVHVICESISYRIPGPLERGRKQVLNPNLTDAILFNFLEEYLQRLEGPLALQVWGRCVGLAKDIVGNVREYKAQVFPVLRCISVLGQKLTATTAIEDRRIRKDLQETFGKLLDASVLIAGRSFDQGLWIRRTNKDPLTPNGRDSPVPRDEGMEASTTSLPDISKSAGGVDRIEQIVQFIATTALPNLRKFLVENDKIITTCNNIIYYIVSPAMKGKTSRPLDIDSTVLEIIREMTRIPVAFKVWKVPVNDALNDSRFFIGTMDAGRKWAPIVKALVNSDKAVLMELLNKITTAPSGNIFTNREYEMLLRSLNLRRVSYVLFTGDKNHFLTQLPAIQEKLVDILRNVPSPVVQSEVYLCIRVLLCRLGPNNLSSFWPVVLTELYRIFSQAITETPSDAADDLQLILAASKFLDLLIVLQTEEFQIHQWVFITDTVDAVYRPDGWFPEAMMDQLAEIVGDLPVPKEKENLTSLGLEKAVLHQGAEIPLSARTTNVNSRRRPLLSSLQQIDSIRDLLPFFSHVSISSYESVYTSGGNVDWDAIEHSLLEDMFDSR